MKLSVIIPARNEAHRIEATLLHVGSYLGQQSYEYEIIVVINDSNDETHSITTRLQSTVMQNLKIVPLEKGGKGNAVKRAMVEHADGDIVMFMDADNATPISEIEKFLPHFNEKHDIVIGSRYTNPELVHDHQPLYRIILSRLSNGIIQTLVVPGIKDTQLGFKAFTKEAAKSIFPLVSIPGWGFDMEVLTVGLAHQYKIKEVGVHWTEYGGGQVPLKAYIESLGDLLKIKINSIRGKYVRLDEKFPRQLVAVRDYDFAGLAGLLAGVCIIPIILNIGLHPAWIPLFPFIGLIGAIFIMWFGKVVSKWQQVLSQFSKFAVVGILNASINFGFLNFISLITGITGGLLVAEYNIPGTILAALNSYLWNKFWVFKTNDDKGVFYHLPKFALVIVLDIIVNGFIIVLFTTYFHPALGLSRSAWLNVAKIFATAIVMLFNFFGYKFIVFRKKSESYLNNQ